MAGVRSRHRPLLALVLGAAVLLGGAGCDRTLAETSTTGEGKKALRASEQAAAARAAKRASTAKDKRRTKRARKAKRRSRRRAKTARASN